MRQDVGRAEILEFIQKVCGSMIDLREHLQVHYEVGEQTTIFKIYVHKDDIGKVLGKRGRNIEAVRILVNGLAAKHQIRCVVLVED